MFARGCDAEVLFTETGAERVEGLHVVAKIVRTRGHAGAHDADINFYGAGKDCEFSYNAGGEEFGTYVSM